MDIRQRQENRFLHMLKGVACIMVVFIHFPLPCDRRYIINALARFAVPTFFIIAGRYLYSSRAQSPAEQRRAIAKKLLRTLRLTLVVWFVYTLFSAFLAYCGGGSVSAWLARTFHPRELLTLLLYNCGGAVRDFMWYLFALVYAYLFAMISVSWSQRTKRVLCAVLLGCFFVMEYLPAVFETRTFRNYLFFGIPFMLVGTFIAEADIRRRTNPRVLTFLAIAGAVTGVADVVAFGYHELPLGMAITTLSLMLLAEHCPEHGPTALVWIGRNLSSGVYCWHFLTAEVLRLLIPDIASNFFLPFIVTACALCVSYALYSLRRFARNMLPSKR